MPRQLCAELSTEDPSDVAVEGPAPGVLGHPSLRTGVHFRSYHVQHSLGCLTQIRHRGVGQFWIFGFESERIENFERPPLFLEGTAPLLGRLVEGVEKALQIRDGLVNLHAAIQEPPKPVLHQAVLPQLTI